MTLYHRRLTLIMTLACAIPAQGAEEPPANEEEQPGTILQRSNKFMDITRAPMTMIESNSPFFQKREMYFFGRVEGEAVHFSSGVLSDDSGAHLRRFRAGLVGRLSAFEGWSYKLEVDLKDSENRLADAYFNWRPGDWGSLRIGNQKIAQTLAGQTSTLTIPFMERPLPVLAFTLDRRLGVGYELHREDWGVQATVFGHDINEQYGSTGYAGRGYYLLDLFDARVHLGGSAMQLNSRNDTAQLRARPESHGTNIRLVDTGEVDNVEKGFAYGLEVAAVDGPYAFRSEFYRSNWERQHGSDPDFNGWYATGSWIVRGAEYNYRHGKFYRPEIQGGRGAWEVAARYSTIDLNSRGIQGGTEDNISLGVNWYSPLHWRVMANLIKVDADGPEGKENPWITQLRVQYYF